MPSERPAAQARVVVTLARGEAQGVFVNVLALQPQARLAATLEAAAPLPTGLDVRVRTVGHVPFRAGRGWALRPTVLVDEPAVHVPAGATQSFYVRVAASTDTPAGQAHGQLRLQGSQAQVVVPVSIVVRPFVLSRAGDWKRGFFTAGGQSDAKLDLLAEAGLNSLSLWHWHPSIYFVRPDLEERLAVLDEYMRRLRSRGFEGPIPFFLQTSFDHAIERLYGVRYPSEAFRQRYVELLGRLCQTARSRAWPELAFVLHDEPSETPDKRRRWQQEAAWVRAAVPEALLYGVFYRAGDIEHLGPLAHIWCTNFGGFGPGARRIDPFRLASAARAQGARLWVYASANVHMDPRVCRYNAGLYAWQWEAHGLYLWGDHDRVTTLDDFGPGAGIAADAVVFLRAGRLVPTVCLEAVREGVDDLRYLVTLEEAVAAARASGDPQAVQTADKARAMLDSLRRQLQGLGRDYAAVVAAWPSLARLPDQVASWIEALRPADPRGPLASGERQP